MYGFTTRMKQAVRIIGTILYQMRVFGPNEGKSILIVTGGVGVEGIAGMRVNWAEEKYFFKHTHTHVI